jgi:hypothetical protein
MKRTFRKYEFTSAAAAQTAIDALGLDDDGNPTHGHTIVHLGHIVTTPATYDNDGNELTAAVLSDNYSVDVLWSGDPVASWDGNMIWCAPIGVHTFGSSSAIAEWTQKCKELHPEFFPTPDEEIEE